MIQIIGGGLAGTEAAWQAASLGVPVTLYEMRPQRTTPVHRTDRLAELVCSNSFRGDKLDNAVGLLKEEMRHMGSLIMQIGERTRVPAGAALAVDRDQFAAAVTAAIEAHPLITLDRSEIRQLPEIRVPVEPVIVATGPLTSADLSADIAAFVGGDHLYFYDAISPIVLAETIDYSTVFRASRWGRSLEINSTGVPRQPGESANAEEVRAGDYLNCALDAEDYARFHDALLRAETAVIHDFDRTKFFEGCLPIEVMASRGPDTLRFGPMKPVGLVDPRTGRRPHAVVQLRQDNLAGDHFSMVGFQTQLKWGEQDRVFRMIPGLARAEFVRFGIIHRNTYINAPTVLRDTWQTRARPDMFFAGQLSGVEGYVESAASGLMAGLNAAAFARGQTPRVPPRTTALGALAHYAANADPRNYQPTNIAFGLIPPLEKPPRRRTARRLAVARRALRDVAAWRSETGTLTNERQPAVFS